MRASFAFLFLSMFFGASVTQGQDPLVLGSTLPPVEVGPVTYIVDQTNDAVYAAVDLNDDGDINDLDEITIFMMIPLWRKPGNSALYRLWTGWGSYVGDSNGDFILRLVDTNWMGME